MGILNNKISLKENIKLLFSNMRNDEKTHLGLGDIRLTIGMQERIIKMIDEAEKETLDNTNKSVRVF